MLIQVEFFRRARVAAEEETVRVNRGQFAGEKDAEIYALQNRPANADGFRIVRDGVVRKTVLIDAGNSN